MVNINLLPTATEHDHVALKSIQIMIVSSFLLSLTCHLYLFLQNRAMNFEIGQLRTEMRDVQAVKLTQPSSLPMIETMLAYHHSLIQLFRDYTAVSHRHVCLNSIEHHSGQFYFSGTAQSMFHIMQYIKALADANLFSELQHVEQQKNNFIFFRLKISEKNKFLLNVFQNENVV